MNTSMPTIVTQGWLLVVMRINLQFQTFSHNTYGMNWWTYGEDGFGRGRTHDMMPGKMLNSRSSILGLNTNLDSQMPLTLSQMDIELLDKESNKCKKEEMMEYLLYLSREFLLLREHHRRSRKRSQESFKVGRRLIEVSRGKRAKSPSK